MKIYSVKDTELWWSNEDGWVDYDSATTFTEEEAEQLSLPMEGRWDRTPEEFLGEEFQISEALSFLMDLGVVHNYADDFGEPGYSLDNDNGFFVTGYWWCRDRYSDCPKRADGDYELHDIAIHYRRLFERLIEAGMETDFFDEWIIVDAVQVGEYPNIRYRSLAYRCQSDSYSWQPSYMEHEGEYLTPHDGIEVWIEACLERGIGLSARCWTEADLIEQGFEEFNCDYESGWFEGQTDDPNVVMKELRERMGETHDILPFLKENSQFYIKFCVFTREKKGDVEAE